jgi:cell division inhibitor SepF
MLTKLKGFLGLDEPEEYDAMYDEEFEESELQGLYEEEVPSISQTSLEEGLASRRRERPSVAAASNRQFNSDVNMNSQPAPRNNVIGMPGVGNSPSEVIVVEPRSFEEMPQVIQSLRERRSVILNLTIMDPDEAQRAVDFIAGGTYAIDGHQERIGESIFLFTPSNVQVSTQSGVVHEATSIPQAPARPNAPSPAWDSSPLESMAQ